MRYFILALAAVVAVYFIQLYIHQSSLAATCQAHMGDISAMACNELMGVTSSQASLKAQYGSSF